MLARIPVLALSLIVFATACSRGYAADSEPAPAASAGAFDPVGGFDFVASMGMESRTGTLDIRRTATGYAGEATLEGESEAATITGLTINGNHVTIALALTNGPISMELDFEGNDSFSGMILAGGDVVDVDGTRRAQ